MVVSAQNLPLEATSLPGSEAIKNEMIPFVACSRWRSAKRKLKLKTRIREKDTIVVNVVGGRSGCILSRDRLFNLTLSFL